jgi:hypothetical protein
MRLTGAIVLVLASGWQTAQAAPPSEKDAQTFRRAIVSTEMIADNPASARPRCAQAKDFATRFDRNDFWLGLVERCYAMIDELAKNKAAACAGYKRAAALFAKAPRNERLGPDVNGDYIDATQKKLRELGC